jgi:hypothetical protein
MSHATVLVLTETGSEDEVSTLMEPYNEDGEWFRGRTGDRPESKWDWWKIGGRYSGRLNGKNVAPVSELPEDFEYTLAVLTPDGQWHEWGRLGWWGTMSEEKSESEWEEQFKELLREHPDSVAVLVDYHV